MDFEPGGGDSLLFFFFFFSTVSVVARILGTLGRLGLAVWWGVGGVGGGGVQFWWEWEAHRVVFLPVPPPTTTGFMLSLYQQGALAIARGMFPTISIAMPTPVAIAMSVSVVVFRLTFISQLYLIRGRPSLLLTMY